MIDYSESTIKEAVKDLPIYGEYDIVVAGGGVAGVGAALAAGKRGYKVLIIEATSALGGLVTMGLVNIPLDFVSGLGQEMFDELTAINGLWHRNTCPEKHKLVLDRLCKKYNVECLLVTSVVDAVMEGNSLRGAVIQTKTGRKVVLAKRFIDASGDSDLAFYAGADIMQGRVEDNMSMGCSLEFTLSAVDYDKYLESDVKREDPKWVKTIQEDLASGLLPIDIDNHLNWMTHIPGRPQHCGQDEVSICFAHSRRCFPADNTDLTRMYIEGREQCHMLAEYIKKRMPGFENSYLSTTGSLLGVRESRRVVGEYVMTAYDLASCAKHEDVITISSHGYDVHGFECSGNLKWAPIDMDGETKYVVCSAGGFGTTVAPPNGKPVVNFKGQTADFAEFEANRYYDIPYRAILPKTVDNLLVAGRNLSADIYAQSGCRLIMACFTMGEAAGTASAISVKQEVAPRALDIKTLQTELILNGVNIGQKFRKIEGLEKIDVSAPEKYPSWEFITESKVVQGRETRFTKGK